MDADKDQYLTVSGPAKGLFKDRGSKFIAYLFHADTENSFKLQLDFIKSQEPAARHHCWAYRMHPEEVTERFNDDGEPSHSAGTPILRALQGADLMNVACVVVRYFGGTKLGVPGLIAAYKGSAEEAIAQADVLTKYITRDFTITFNYDQLAFVERTARECDAEIVNREQLSTATYTLRVLRSKLNETLQRFETNHLLELRAL